jgi:hypothetical protein
MEIVILEKRQKIARMTAKHHHQPVTVLLG